MPASRAQRSLDQRDVRRSLGEVSERTWSLDGRSASLPDSHSTHPQIDDSPDSKECRVNVYKWHTSGKAGNRVSHFVQEQRPLSDELLRAAPINPSEQ
jgi:hypothetical protein